MLEAGSIKGKEEKHELTAGEFPCNKTFFILDEDIHDVILLESRSTFKSPNASASIGALVFYSLSGGMLKGFRQLMILVSLLFENNSQYFW